MSNVTNIEAAPYVESSNRRPGGAGGRRKCRMQLRTVLFSDAFSLAFNVTLGEVDRYIYFIFRSWTDLSNHPVVVTARQHSLLC